MRHNLDNERCNDIFRVAWLVEQQSEGNQAENAMLFHDPCMLSQATMGISRPMLVQCWSTVYDVGPTLTQHWFNMSCLTRRPSPVAGERDKWQTNATK